MPAPVQPGNPFKPGTARFKLWNRRETERKAKEGPPPPEQDVSGGDESKRRRALDDAIEGRKRNQSTDSNN